MARMQSPRPHLVETGGATCLFKWLLGILFVLTSLRTATCWPADTTETENLPRPGVKCEMCGDSQPDNMPNEAADATLDSTSPDGQKDVLRPTPGVIINAIVASVGKTPEDVHTTRKTSAHTLRFKQKSGHRVPPRGGRMMRGLSEDMKKFSIAWRDLNWKHHWSLLVLTMLVSCTTLVLLSVVIGVKCTPSTTGPSILDRLRLHNEIRREILARRKQDIARLEERQSLLMNSDVKDNPRRGHRSSQKQEQTYRAVDVDSESAESTQPRRKSSSRRQSMRSSTSLKRDHGSHRNTVAGVHESQ